MTTTAEDSSIHAATAREGGPIAIDLDVHLLMFCRLVVQRTIGDGVNIHLLRLVHACHVG